MFSKFICNKIIYLNDRHEEKDTQFEDREKLYDKRILSLLDKNDLVVFGGRIDGFLWDYYKILGLARIKNSNIFYVQDYLKFSSLTEAVLNSRSIIQQIKRKSPDMLVPYIISKNTQALAQKINCRSLSNFETVDYVNNKYNYRKIIQNLGFTIIPGYRASNLEEAKKYFNYLKKQDFNEIVIKKERSVAGFGVFIVKTEKELEKYFFNNFVKEKFFILEGFIKEVKIYPNAQYWIGPDKIQLIALSDQLFEKNRVSHNGNLYPSQISAMPDLLNKVGKLSYSFCRYLQKRKCFGLAGIDYLITKDNDIFSTEANCRINYSTFPALIVKKLFSPSLKHFAWKTFMIKGRPIQFSRLFSYARNIFINKKNSFGVFPIDVGILESKGEGQFMAIAPGVEQVDNYMKELNKIYENIPNG